MTREEVTKLLEILTTAYPNTKIKNASQMADVWEMEFSSYNAESVFKAARLCIEKSEFFPTPAKILNEMTRAELVYNESIIETVKLEAPKEARKTITDEQLEDLCKFVGLGYANDIEGEPDDI